MVLNWEREAKRWHVWQTIAGKRRHYAISCRQLRRLHPQLMRADTKEGSEAAAREWWEAKEKELAALPSSERPEYVKEIIKVHNRTISTLERAGYDLGKLAEMPLPDRAAVFNGLMRTAEALKENAPDADKTVQHHIESFTKKCERDTRAGVIAAGRYQKIVNSLDWYSRFLSEECLSTIESIDADMLDAYYAWLRKQHKDKVLSVYTTRDHWQVFRFWVQWLAEKRLIQLPLNINAKRFKFDLPKVKYRYWTAAEFQEVYTPAHDRLKLYLLLIANCGFYASDIAAIRKRSEFKEREGVIERQRTKTGELLDDGYEPSGGVPTVRYYLWPETLKLLRRYLADSGDICLVNEDGGPLWQDGINEKGKYFKNDNIASVYKRFIRDKLKLTNPNTLENLRKTSAQFLSDSEYRDCANTFGGWSPKSVREKHYTEVSDARFREALDFLHTKYGFSS